jgi:hypothetical protein
MILTCPTRTAPGLSLVSGPKTLGRLSELGLDVSSADIGRSGLAAGSPDGAGSYKFTLYEGGSPDGAGSYEFTLYEALSIFNPLGFPGHHER